MFALTKLVEALNSLWALSILLLSEREFLVFALCVSFILVMFVIVNIVKYALEYGIELGIALVAVKRNEKLKRKC